MKFAIKDFLSKCDQIRSLLPIWSHLLKKSLMENFIFCAVFVTFPEGTIGRYSRKYLVLKHDRKIIVEALKLQAVRIKKNFPAF